MQDIPWLFKAQDSLIYYSNNDTTGLKSQGISDTSSSVYGFDQQCQVFAQSTSSQKGGAVSNPAAAPSLLVKSNDRQTVLSSENLMPTHTNMKEHEFVSLVFKDLCA